MTKRATILDHIGNTPLLKLNHVTDNLGVDIYVKCEFTNPEQILGELLGFGAFVDFSLSKEKRGE